MRGDPTLPRYGTDFVQVVRAPSDHPSLSSHLLQFIFRAAILIAAVRGIDLPTLSRGAPGNQRFFREIINRLPILNDHFRPGPFTHLRKVNTTKTKARDQYACAMFYGLVTDRLHGARNAFGTVGILPRVIDLCLSLLNAHL